MFFAFAMVFSKFTIIEKIYIYRFLLQSICRSAAGKQSLITHHLLQLDNIQLFSYI
jgi:hypothetical protein